LNPYHPFPPTDRSPYIIAHRGLSGKAPENTLASFQKAIATVGVDMVELDVRISKDEEVIVLHDRSLQRTTTGNGSARLYTAEEVQSYDAGSWFHPSFSGEKIPLLRTVLELARGKCWVNIELKGDFLDRGSDSLVKKTLETVRECGMQDFVLYSSFKHDLLARVHKLDPNATTGVIYNVYRDLGKPPSKLAQRVRASVFVCAKHELRRSMIRDAHQHGISLYVYTLNAVVAVKKMVEFGIDGIISDVADEIVGFVTKAM
jgi:glycerophosphoryl diester phosphodiesterase